MNRADSAALKAALDEINWREAANAQDASFIVINTCAVRATAEQRVFGRIAHYAALKKKGAKLTLVVTGCMAARLGDALLERGVDFVLPPGPPDALRRIALSLAPSSEMGEGATPVATAPFDFRAELPVMRGCNNFCSYCVVPYVRGPEHSRSPQKIRREIAAFAEQGVREITLLGQNVLSYRYGEAGAEVDFPALLEMVARWTENTSVRRVRFLSSHPKDFSARTIAALRDHPVFCRHLHVCAQHGSNHILQMMNRRYTREQYLDLVAQLRAALPELSLSTDILVGFPGETEEEFEKVLTLMREVKFLYAFMYHYNPREGTAAFTLEGKVSAEIKQDRLRRVIALQKTHTEELLASRIGCVEEVLVEGASKKNPNELLCRTGREESVIIAGASARPGSFISVKLLKLNGNTFRAEPVLRTS